MTQGLEEVIVAVIDTGIDYHHPDLTDNILRYCGGSCGDPPCGGVVRGDKHCGQPVGYNFVARNDDPLDDNGHGTHVAGTIAAAENGLGVVGVAPKIKLVAVKFLDDWGSGYLADAIDSIQYVADLKHEGIHVRISNNSWGGSQFSQALHDAIQACGHLFVASAGNSWADGLRYPSGYDLPNVIAVAATDHRDELARFSTFGEWVHIAAPGVSILSTVLNEIYDYYDGTSMAAPHVSGAAALVLSRWVEDVEGPLDLANMTDTEIEELKMHLIDTATKVDGLKIGPDPEENEPDRQNKRLKVAAALGITTERPEPQPDILDQFEEVQDGHTLVAYAVYQNAVTLRWNYPEAEEIYAYDIRHRAHTSIDGTWHSGTSFQRIPRPQNQESEEHVQVGDLFAGTEYSLQMQALDPWGNTSPLSSVVDIKTPPAEWLLHTLGANAGLWRYTAVAVHGDRVHLAYVDESDWANRTVRHLWLEGNEWRSEPVAPGIDGLSIAIDPNGHPSLSFDGLIRCLLSEARKWATTSPSPNPITRSEAAPSATACFAPWLT